MTAPTFYSQKDCVFIRTMSLKAICRFRDMNPTDMGTVGGYRFFECPIHGDESTLYATKEGVWGKTHFWEVPSLDEIVELREHVERREQ